MATLLDTVSRPGESRETGWVNRLFTKEGYTPEYQELKFTLHRKLLDRINLEALSSMAGERVRAEIRAAVAKLLDEEKTPLSLARDSRCFPGNGAVQGCGRRSFSRPGSVRTRPIYVPGPAGRSRSSPRVRFRGGAYWPGQGQIRSEETSDRLCRSFPRPGSVRTRPIYVPGPESRSRSSPRVRFRGGAYWTGQGQIPHGHRLPSIGR